MIRLQNLLIAPLVFFSSLISSVVLSNASKLCTISCNVERRWRNTAPGNDILALWGCPPETGRQKLAVYADTSICNRHFYTVVYLLLQWIPFDKKVMHTCCAMIIRTMMLVRGYSSFNKSKLIKALEQQLLNGTISSTRALIVSCRRKPARLKWKREKTRSALARMSCFPGYSLVRKAIKLMLFCCKLLLNTSLPQESS